MLNTLISQNIKPIYVWHDIYLNVLFNNTQHIFIYGYMASDIW